MLDEMIQQNTSKFGKLYGYKKKAKLFLLFYFEEKKHKLAHVVYEKWIKHVCVFANIKYVKF